MARARERLRKSVGGVVGGRAIFEREDLVAHTIAHEVVADVDVFAARVILRVDRESDRALVIDLEERRRGLGVSEFAEDTTEPDGFARGMADRHVFGLHAGERDGRLPFRAPRDRAGRESEYVTGDGAAVVHVAPPVRVRVARERERAGGALISDAAIGRAFEIAEHVLGGGEVLGSRISQKQDP